jgi:hypothetical protein
MQFTQVINFINNSGLTNNQLNEIGQALEHAKSQLQYRTIQQLNKGDTVSFFNRRTGKTMTGQITRIAIKNVHVSTPEGNWQVPANVLTQVNVLVDK